MTQPETQHQQYDYDEIDLRDIFRTLGKWKYKIISFTLVCMLLSGIVSWFFIKPVYEAKVVVALASITPLTGSGNYSYIIKEDLDNGSSKISDNIDDLVRLSQVDTGKYQQLVTSINVLNNTIKEQKLNIKAGSLKNNIKIAETKEKNGVIEISVQSKDPEKSARIANTLVAQTIDYLSDINNRKIEGLRKTLESQLLSARSDLDTAFTSLQEYQIKSADTQNNEKTRVIKSEIEKKRLETEVKRNEDLVNSLSSKIIELEIFKSLNSAENQIIVLSKATVPDAPIKPKKILNLAIATVLGLMVSVSGVFLIENLRNEQ